MDSLETLAFARSLIDIDSTTGREAEAGQWRLLDNITLRGRRAGTRLAAPSRAVLHRGFAISDGTFTAAD